MGFLRPVKEHRFFLTNHEQRRTDELGKSDRYRPLFGLLFLIVLTLGLLVAKPWLDRLLPAGNLAYLFRDGHYLILFQNNSELRASGGFIGSYGEVDIRRGRPGEVDFGTNIYKLDDPFTDTVTIPPPKPLTEIAQGKWAFRDSNWAADFPEAARQAMWFYERETEGIGQPKKVDGVIALTTTVVEELLRLTGPIEMPEYATTLNADNFAEVVQFKIEKEYFENRANWPVDEPKTILRDLIPMLEERVRSVDKTKLLELAFRLLDDKYVLLYSNDSLAQRLILERSWGGSVDQASGNYLYLVNSNVQGLKSSRKINERIRYTLNTAKRQVTLYIERQHTGSWVWPDYENKNWVRVLVPKGSKITSATFGITDGTRDVDVGEEAGKVVFGFWMNTKPQETQDATIIFELPQSINFSPLTIQRQPGANPDEMTIATDGTEKFQGTIERDTDIEL